MTRTRLRYFDFFEHEADVGIVGVGRSVEEAFEEGAKAMFHVMADIQKVEPRHRTRIEVEAPDEEALFVEWLNALLAQKDIEDMCYSDFKVRIQRSDDNLVLVGVAVGERSNPQKHHFKTEVKAATYGQLRVEESKGEYRAQCVVDV
jgi:SHS2 domain-containing protein